MIAKLPIEKDVHFICIQFLFESVNLGVLNMMI